MVTSCSRGHQIFFDNRDWRYCDTKEIVDVNRPCKRCGNSPTKEGHDACLGNIPGASSACCGHGVEAPYTIY